MAPSPKHLSFFFLLFLLFLSSSLQTEAREGHPFRNRFRFYEVEPKVNGNGVPSVQNEPTTFTPQSKKGYGLYGNGPEELPQTTFENSPAKFPATGKKELDFGYVNNEYNNKQYGMSDTRYVENGKYFYDVKGNQHGKSYQTLKGKGQEFESSEGNNDNKDENFEDSEWVDNGNKYFDASKVVDTRNKYSYGGYGNNERNKYNYGGYGNNGRSKYNYGGYGNSEGRRYGYGGYGNGERSKYNYGGYENNGNGDEFNTYQNQEEYEP